MRPGWGGPDDVGAPLETSLGRPRGLVLQTFQCATGELVNASRSFSASRSRTSRRRRMPAEHGRDDVELAADVFCVGLREHMRIAAVTNWALPLRTRSRTSRMTCTRQRCQLR